MQHALHSKSNIGQEREVEEDYWIQKTLLMLRYCVRKHDEHSEEYYEHPRIPKQTEK